MHGTPPSRPARRIFAVLGLAFLFGPGCGGRGEVSGKVTYDGQPIPWGRVFFHSEGDKKEVLNSRIVNGEYRIPNVPTGPVRIAVESFPAPGGGKGEEGDEGAGAKMAEGFKGMMKDRAPVAPSDVAGKYLEIPPDYADIEKSGLTYDVSRGSQVHDIPLPP
jgi:hypothetical protein